MLLATATAQSVGSLDVEEVVAPATAVVAVVAGTCLEEAVEADSVVGQPDLVEEVEVGYR